MTGKDYLSKCIEIINDKTLTKEKIEDQVNEYLTSVIKILNEIEK